MFGINRGRAEYLEQTVTAVGKKSSNMRDKKFLPLTVSLGFHCEMELGPF